MSESYDVPPAGGTGATASLDLNAVTQPQANSYMDKPAKPALPVYRARPITGLRLALFNYMFRLTGHEFFMKRTNKDRKILASLHGEALAEDAARTAAFAALYDEALADNDAHDERRQRHSDIVALRNERRRTVTIFVANQAGSGSKTTTCAYLALTFVKHLKGVPVVIVECRRDSAEGVRKHRLDENKVESVREFHRRWRDGAFNGSDGRLSNELVFEQLAQSDEGVFYLQADIKAPKSDTFRVTAARDVMRVLKTTNAIIIVDSGNNPTDEITLGMANECVIGVYPTTTMAKSITLRRRTIDVFSEQLTSTITSDYISVLNGVKPHQSIAGFRDEPASYVDPARFFWTEFDSHMEDEAVIDATNDGTKAADLTKITQFNRDSFEKMAQEVLAIFALQGKRQQPASIPVKSSAQVDPIVRVNGQDVPNV